MYVNPSQSQNRKPVNVSQLRRMKAEGERIACLTAYDYAFAALLDEVGVDVILIGDSLGMVMQGRETTLGVTVDEIVYHTRCVAAARRHALIMADMPFLSYGTIQDAMDNAARLMKEGGAHMIKLEGNGDQAELVKRLTSAGVPVCAHLGLQPQFVHKLGGYKVQGRQDEAADRMVEDAKLLEEAGADVILLECVPAELGARITREVQTPVIGIGAGVECDGQILVLQDMLGITPGKPPKFSRNFLTDQGNIAEAVGAYVAAVKDGSFPGPEHVF